MIDKGSNSVDEPMVSNSDLPHQSEYTESPGEVDMLIGFIVINGACIGELVYSIRLISSNQVV